MGQRIFRSVLVASFILAEMVVTYSAARLWVFNAATMQDVNWLFAVQVTALAQVVYGSIFLSGRGLVIWLVTGRIISPFDFDTKIRRKP